MTVCALATMGSVVSNSVPSNKWLFVMAWVSVVVEVECTGEMVALLAARFSWMGVGSSSKTAFEFYVVRLQFG